VLEFLFAEPAAQGPQPAELPHFKLVRLPAEGTSAAPEVLYEHASYWAFSPIELAPRQRPTMNPGTGRAGFGYGILNSKDVFLRGINTGKVVNSDDQPAPQAGEVVNIEIFTLEFERSGSVLDPELRSSRRRLLGNAPIAEDGSFAAVVPAGVPLFWRALRPDNTVLVQEPFFTEVRPGQVVSCNGCHSPHDGREGRVTNAAIQNPVNLTGADVDLDDNGVVDLLE
jgi:hypothetical protein